MADFWIFALLLVAGVVVVVAVLVLRTRRKAPGSAAPEALEGGVALSVPAGAAEAEAVSVRLRVFRVLAGWAGVEETAVPPGAKKLADLWRQTGLGPLLTDGHLSDLVNQLRDQFPQAGLKLSPRDLRDGGGVDTVSKLVLHVELRMQ